MPVIILELRNPRNELHFHAVLTKWKSCNNSLSNAYTFTSTILQPFVSAIASSQSVRENFAFVCFIRVKWNEIFIEWSAVCLHMKRKRNQTNSIPFTFIYVLSVVYALTSQQCCHSPYGYAVRHPPTHKHKQITISNLSKVISPNGRTIGCLWERVCSNSIYRIINWDFSISHVRIRRHIAVPGWLPELRS